MRQRVLVRSVERRLPAGERVDLAAVLTRHHPAQVPAVVAAFVVPFGVALALGAGGLTLRFALGVAGASVAALATTDYRILAGTSSGLVLLAASRIRQVATGVLRHLPPGTEIEPAGGTLVASEWDVDGTRYLVTKRHERAIEQMARSV